MSDIEMKNIEALYQRLTRDAADCGYQLNPDRGLVNDLLEGLLVNEDRYGYMACPCRLAMGSKSDDLDIICPCYYRDEDLEEHGSCYCALYVSERIARGEAAAQSIPDRRIW